MIRLAADIAASENSTRSVRTFREILVDEYQDTNPLQDRLIDSVAAEGCRRFLVGDPKQSIYRFRHADPTLFGERIASPSAQTRYIPLQTSFRTRPALLKEINGLFGGIWRNGLASTLPTPYEELLFPENPRDAGAPGGDVSPSGPSDLSPSTRGRADRGDAQTGSARTRREAAGAARATCLE